MSEFKPDWKSSAGDTLLDIMNEYGLNVEYVAIHLNISIDDTIQILMGRKYITEDNAIKLSKCFGGLKIF